MYKKIGILSLLLLFVLTIITVALSMEPQEKTAVSSTQVSPISPTAKTLPDGNYIISTSNNVVTKISYTPLPQSGSLTSASPTVLYDSQQPGNTKGVFGNIIHAIRKIIDAVDCYLNPQYCNETPR